MSKGRDYIFEGFCEVMGIVGRKPTKSERKRINFAVPDLLDSGIDASDPRTAVEIVRRAKLCREEYKRRDIFWKPMSLAARWGEYPWHRILTAYDLVKCPKCGAWAQPRNREGHACNTPGKRYYYECENWSCQHKFAPTTAEVVGESEVDDG